MPITTGMLKPIREDAGLGVPPAIFTTNASESINFILKRKVNHNKKELPLFVTHLKEIIDEQQGKVERAIIGRGKYQFCDEYKYSEIPESKWFRMSRQQRQKHFEKISKVKLDNHTNELALVVSWDITPD